MIYQVEEVNSNFCTGLLSAKEIENKINSMADAGFKFEQLQTIMGTSCLCVPRYKAIICFSKEE